MATAVQNGWTTREEANGSRVKVRHSRVVDTVGTTLDQRIAALLHELLPPNTEPTAADRREMRMLYDRSHGRELRRLKLAQRDPDALFTADDADRIALLTLEAEWWASIASKREWVRRRAKKNLDRLLHQPILTTDDTVGRIRRVSP